MSVAQFRNSEMIQLLRGEFQARNEKNFSLANITSTFLAFPGLVGFWPMSSIDAANNGDVFDISGNGRTLTNNNTVVASSDGLIPYCQFTAANTEYLERADEAGLDIIGNEAYIADNGLTLGGWFYIDSDTGSNQGLIHKRLASTPNISYFLSFTTAEKVTFGVNSGAVGNTLTSDTVLPLEQWFYVVGRYIPSTSIAVYVLASTEEKKVLTSSIVATLANSTAALRIGARGDNTSYMDGRASFCFLCASALSDTTIYNSFYQSRILFGV